MAEPEHRKVVGVYDRPEPGAKVRKLVLLLVVLAIVVALLWLVVRNAEAVVLADLESLDPGLLTGLMASLV